MKILFTGGGTGGHIFPIIAIFREIKRIYPKESLKCYFIGPKDEFSSILFSQEGIKTKWIEAGKIRRYWNPITFFQNIFDIFFRIPFGILQSFFHIFFLAPDMIFSKGGYGSVPAAVAGRILGVPVFLHESDSSIGMANKFLSKLATEIFVSFPIKRTGYLPLRKVLWVGNPIRREILHGTEDEAREMFKLTLEKPVILILGGSQGAQSINEKVIENLSQMLQDFELIHQCGEKNYKQIKAEVEAVIHDDIKKYYHLYPFFKEIELKQAYAAADLIVSRGGSGSIFEIAALGKPSIIIPLPESAQDHQATNAYFYAESGATTVIEESNLTSRFFLEKLRYLFTRPQELEKMKKSAEEFAKPLAAKIIASYIIAYLSPKNKILDIPIR